MISLHVIGEDEGKFIKIEDVSEKLSEIRKEIKKIINKPFLFSFNQTQIHENAEEDFILKDILIDNKEFFVKLINEPIPEAKFIEEDAGLKIYEYPNQKLNNYEESTALIILLIGETGSGKTTLINSLVNYLLNIQFNDHFRYKIIIDNFYHSQDESMTEEVNIYNIKPTNGLPPIKIIDTPGFGDTRGPAQVQIIRNKIEETFRNKITTINAICFVAKCGNARLTQSQRYIFSSVFSLFGKDVAENIFFLLTFYDGSKPFVLDVLEEEEIISRNIIPKVKEKNKNWYYTFNNKRIFNSERTEINKMFYDITMKEFKDFFLHLKNIPQKSLTQSKEVIQHRKDLIDSINSLTQSLKLCLDNMNALNSIKKIIKDFTENLNEFRNFKIKQKVSEAVKVPDNSTNLVCEKCKFTCHKDCWNILKTFIICNVFKDGKCTVCPSKCGKDSHVRATDYYYEYQEKEIEVEVGELKEKYCKTEKGPSEKQRLLKGLEEGYQKEKDKCLQIQQQITDHIKDHVNRLNEIALSVVSSESSEDYIRLAIKEEERKKKPGYEHRIDSLKQLLIVYKLLRETYKKENQSFEEFIETFDRLDFLEEEEKVLE